VSMLQQARFAAVALALTNALAGPSLHAQDKPAAEARIEPRAVEEKNVLSGKTKLEAEKGYIFVSGPARQFGAFLRVPDDATRAGWEQDRQKAFAKALKGYKSQLAAWNTEITIAKQSGAKLPPKPEEPTLETFQFEPIDLRDQVSFGPQFVYAKGEMVSYLQAVKPGTYIWYGNIFGGNGVPAAGTCMCMGTVRFEVKAGVVTDLGNWLLAAPKWDDDLDVARLTLKIANEKRVAEGKEPRTGLVPTDAKFGLPASLKEWPSVQAEFYANPKINNYFGIFVSRMAPIPGVLGYNRDTVVDLRTGQEVESPTLVSRARIKK